jgi:hypothetical protein
MKRWLLSLFLISILIFATAAAAFARGGPGPGESHNGKCTGKPSDRIGGC